jgi:hypothetical protein
LFKSWFPGVGWAHNRDIAICTCVYIEKPFFSRTSGPISIKLGINHPWLKKIKFLQINDQVLSLGDSYKNEKLVWGHLKISSRTT